MMTLPQRRAYYDVENYEDVYAGVEQTWQNPERAARYHAVINRVFKPIVLFAPGAEDRFEQEIADGAQVAIAFSHGKYTDPIHLALPPWHHKTESLKP
jgi:hypothetical protein